jgi:hypothetical protein
MAMNLDEWVALVKTMGPGDFKLVAVQFLREFFGCAVQYADGTGDGGVDAWVALQQEPRVRRAAQFYAGSGDWESKLSEDVETFASFRDSLPEDGRGDFEILLFVCTQTPSATKFEMVAEGLRQKHKVVARLLDARAIASLALQNRTRLLDLLAERLPGWRVGGGNEPSALEETLAAFSFFHSSPSKYRWAVAKSGLTTVLHRKGNTSREELLRETSLLLGLREDSTLPAHALRNLASEGLVSVDETSGKVHASEDLVSRTSTTLKIAQNEEQALRDRCAADLALLFPKGSHERDRRAQAIVDSVVGDLGALVRGAVVQRALRAADAADAATKQDASTRKRLHTIEQRLSLGPYEGKRALEVLIAAAAQDPFARRLAAAEVFVRFTEHDAGELERALDRTSLRIMLDASIAMPVLCACYDRIATTWPVSIAAHALYGALKSRQATIVVPSVYLEEMASHLLKAQSYATVIATNAELERSENYFVAHYCSTRDASERDEEEFRGFLEAFGATSFTSSEFPFARARAEREIAKVMARYAIDVAEIPPRDDQPLRDEPPRADVLLRHDRAVIRGLQGDRAETIVCTADTWLQSTLMERGITALDSSSLADLLELVRPTGTERSLVSPLSLARSLSEEAMSEAARVWDAIVEIEGERLDWKLIERAKKFRDEWLNARRTIVASDNSTRALQEAWARFRGEASS